jgi:hypothetical protein
MLPPIVSLDETSQAALTATVVGPGRFMLSGLIEDNNQVSRVEICNHPASVVSSVSCKPVELAASYVVTGTWSTTLLFPLGVDYTSQTLSFFGWDAAGNRSTLPLENTVWFDTMAPKVTVTTRLPSISLPAYSANPQPILGGTASDGSGHVEIVVRITAPGFGAQRTVVPVQNNQWSYIPKINATGKYSLSLQARDTAGNLTSFGSWTLEVTDGYKLWLPVINR